MIVRMSRRQFEVFQAALSTALAYWFEDEVSFHENGKGKMGEFRTIPDFWKAALDHLIATQFTPGSIKSAGPSLMAATKRIAHEVNARRTHPAFRCEALFGWQFDYLPAWLTSDGLKPFYEIGADFCPLEPNQVRVGAQHVTEWTTMIGPYPDDPIFQAETYERFRSSIISGRMSRNTSGD